MLNICSCYTDEFLLRIKDKKIIIFGCGKATKSTLELFQDTDIYNNIIAFTDNNQALWGQEYSFNNKNYPIIGISSFVNLINKNKNIALVIAVSEYLGPILKQLDEIDELNDLETYLSLYLRMLSTKKDFDFPQGKSIIPKKIHYCWFGRNPIPKHLQECIDTWKNFCPDYEIIRWDESNYDYTKNNYMKQAYEAKKWGFVPDYARLDIIYNHGGIYLDTDVKLKKSLNYLLSTQAFLMLISKKQVAAGLGFGAVEKNELIKILRDDYNDKNFILEDGTLNLKPCNTYQSPILEQYGFKLDNEFELLNGCAIYPTNVIIPMYDNYTKHISMKNTLGIHLGEASWYTKERKNNRILLNEQLEKHKEL